MIKIAPSILASDFSKLGSEIEKIEKAGADLVHVDVMDGHFVPNITIGAPVVASLKAITKLPLDVHLMISEPEKYVEAFAAAGADIITIHAEATVHLNRIVNKIKELGKKAGVSINPATSLSVLDYILEDADMFLLMSVNPGFGGQKYIKSVTKKIRTLRETLNAKGLKTDIEVDGGIDLTNIGKVTEAGANVIVAGSTIYKAADTTEIINQLRELSYKTN